MERENAFMREAISLGRKGMLADEGGPFGCVIVKDNVIVGRGWNQVTTLHDPTAHAEVMAIRDACQSLVAFQLSGCEVYSSCEPCPMCMGALYWARPAVVYYGARHADAAAAGFDDSYIYAEVALPIDKRHLPMHNLIPETAASLFREWEAKENKINY